MHICDVAPFTIGKGLLKESNGKHESGKIKERRGTKKIKNMGGKEKHGKKHENREIKTK
jgi:hypothetical protein